MSRRPFDVFCLASLVALALLFVPRLLLSASPLYTELLTDSVLRRIASLGKLLFLALASLYATRCVGYFESGNRVRPGWGLLAVGMGAYFLGQAALGYYQLIRAVEAPFPSLADLFFVASMLALVAALVVFLDAYRRIGYLGEPGPTLVFALVCLAVVGAVLALLLRPVLAEPAPFGEQALNIAYPVLDGLLLLPALLLMRMTAQMRGGRLWRVWTLLLLGFLFVAAGDVVFAYFSTLGMTFLDPLLHLLFAGAYVLIAWGTHEQLTILTE